MSETEPVPDESGDAVPPVGGDAGKTWEAEQQREREETERLLEQQQDQPLAEPGQSPPSHSPEQEQVEQQPPT
jgi:hypothetical protein